MKQINAKYICLVDLRLTGHHIFYLANFADVFQMLGYSVDIFTSDTNKCSDEIKKAMPNISYEHISFIQSNVATYQNRRILGCRTYFNLLKLQKEITNKERIGNLKYELVFFAYLDDFSHIDFKLPYLIKSPFKDKFSGLLMAPRDRLLKSMSYPTRMLTTSFLKDRHANYDEIGLLVEDVKNNVEDIIGKRTIVYPDFCSIEPITQVNTEINVLIENRKNKRFTSSLIGSIQSHKSVDLFLECVKCSDKSKHFFVVAGKFHKKSFSKKDWQCIEEIKSNPPENLLIVDEWIESEAVFDSIVQQSDCLFAFYREFKKSSNILTKSAFYKKPIIVSKKYLMGNRVEKYKLGFSLTEKEVLKLYKNNTQIELFKYNEELRELFVNLNSATRLIDIFKNIL